MLVAAIILACVAGIGALGATTTFRAVPATTIVVADHNGGTEDFPNVHAEPINLTVEFDADSIPADNVDAIADLMADLEPVLATIQSSPRTPRRHRTAWMLACSRQRR